MKDDCAIEGSDEYIHDLAEEDEKIIVMIPVKYWRIIVRTGHCKHRTR